ncbi:hypothetical protein [Amycolatopsis sp. NPDC004079]|uniref:hypothetical protein n=1 Tax=Amycolatopsis sp. NPDC004079 TaxID=3154549 RepID=UPI0033A0C55C
MGHSRFLVYQPRADDPETAFRTVVANTLVEAAPGYMRTIAAKVVDGFVIVAAEPVDQAKAEKLAGAIICGDDEQWARIRDKSGPTGLIAVKGGWREHHGKIPAVPGGHADLDAAAAATVAGKLVAGEHVVPGASGGSFSRQGVRVLNGKLTVRTVGAQVHTGWLVFGTVAL